MTQSADTMRIIEDKALKMTTEDYEAYIQRLGLTPEVEQQVLQIARDGQEAVCLFEAVRNP